MEENREQIPEQNNQLQQSNEQIPEKDGEQQIAPEQAIEQEPAEQVSAEQVSAEQIAEKIFDANEAQKPEGAYQYRWNYEEQRAADLAGRSKKRARKWGILVYALTMTAVFVLCFSVLVGVLIHDVMTSPAGG
ncbi:MAG: hypothetical protein J6R46_05120, partial [Clostridia bacterium]|nr:hypothetical protein [Clostridia bacterium]